MATIEEWAELRDQIDQCRHKVKVASRQVVHITNQMAAVNVRYNRAKDAGVSQYGICYNLRLRLTILKRLKAKMSQYKLEQEMKMSDTYQQYIIASEWTCPRL